MGLSVRILVDNQAGKGLVAEHGLALWVEAGDRKLLFDTGQGFALAANAAALGVDPASAGALVLSHGHYDHTGGIAQLPLAGGRIHTYLHPAAVQPHYTVREGLASDIGMPNLGLTALGRVPDENLHWVTEPIALYEDMELTGPIPRHAAFEDTGGPFFLDPGGFRPDPLSDDQALFIKTRKGLIILLGCCHAGLVNTMDRVRELAGDTRIRALIGGLHLGGASDERMEKTIAALAAAAPSLIAPCHCTGEKAMSALKAAFPDKVVFGRSGMGFPFS